MSRREQERSKVPTKNSGRCGIREQQTKMETLITERTYITPLLGMDLMQKFKLTIDRIQLIQNNQSEREKVLSRFPDLFEKKKQTI